MMKAAATNAMTPTRVAAINSCLLVANLRQSHSPRYPQPAAPAAAPNSCANQETVDVSPVRCSGIGQRAAQHSAGDQPGQSPGDNDNDHERSAFLEALLRGSVEAQRQPLDSQHSIARRPGFAGRDRPGVGDRAGGDDLARGERRKLRLSRQQAGQMGERQRPGCPARWRRRRGRSRVGRATASPRTPAASSAMAARFASVTGSGAPTTSAPCSPHAAVQSGAVNFQSGKWLCTISKPGAIHSTQASTAIGSSVDRHRRRQLEHDFGLDPRLHERSANQAKPGRSPRNAPYGSRHAPTSADRRRSAARSCGW